MTLKEILNMISLKYPHSYENDYIVMMVNDIQRRLFRTLCKPETVTTYDLLADNPLYPIKFPPENIIAVVVNGKEYPFQNIKYDALPYFYCIAEDRSIELFPTPETTVTRGLKTYHYQVPRELSSLNDIPDLDASWHMMLVNHTCKQLAGIEGKDKHVDLFTNEIVEMERQFNRSKQARPQRIKDVYGVG